MHPREFHGPKDYLDAALDETAPPEALDALARSPYVFVDIAVASNAATSSATLVGLLVKVSDDWNGDRLLRAIASNPNTPPEGLALVGERVPPRLHERDRQEGFGAGIDLVRRADTPIAVLETMLNHPQATTQFRKVAARETTRSDVLAILRNDRSEKVRAAAAANRHG